MTQYVNPALRSLLLQSMRDEKCLGDATGFVVLSTAGPILFTNRHVVHGTNLVTGTNYGMPNQLKVRHHKVGGGQIETVEKLLDHDNNPLWHEHPTLGQYADFIALRLTQLEGVQINDYDLKNPFFHENPAENFTELVLEPTESVSIIGYPYGKSSSAGLPIWVTGFLATELEDDYKMKYKELNVDVVVPVFIVDSRTREGQSGSPVVAFRPGGTGYRAKKGGTSVSYGAVARFLGIYSGRITSDSDLGMVWKVSALLELLEHVESSFK